MTVNMPVPVVMPMPMSVPVPIASAILPTVRQSIKSGNFDSVLMAKEHVWSGDFYGIFDAELHECICSRCK